jgi:NitT/TauT family transport system permease protein/taurine transport system permease protein
MMITTQQGNTARPLHIVILHILHQLWAIKLFRNLFPFAVVIALWQASVGWVGLSEYFYPTPKATVIAFGDLLKNGVLLAYIRDSLYRYACGCAIGIGIGIPLGVLITVSRRAASLLMPILNFFQSIVEMAWIPIFVLWFGYGFTTILISLAYVVAFPVMFNTVQGVRRVPSATVNAVRVLGAKWYHIAWEVMIPGALPDIVTGVRLGAGYAFRGLVGAEMIAARTGLGYMLFEARQQGLIGRIVVGMIVLGLLWLFLDRVYLKAIERATIERWGMITTAESE